MVGRSIARLPRSHAETWLQEKKILDISAHTLKLTSSADPKYPYRVLATNEGLLEVHATSGRRGTTEDAEGSRVAMVRYHSGNATPRVFIDETLDQMPRLDAFILKGLS